MAIRNYMLRTDIPERAIETRIRFIYNGEPVCVKNGKYEYIRHQIYARTSTCQVWDYPNPEEQVNG